MRFCDVWIEQCVAAKEIEAEFGTQQALEYLIGEKFLNFLQAAETDAEFRAEIPAFVGGIKTNFDDRHPVACPSSGDEPNGPERCLGVIGECLRMSQATRRNVTDAYIESFVQSFENGSLSRPEWTHSRHLVIALWYLRHHNRDEATSLIRDGIQRLNERQGNLTGYHETITLAWVAVIEQFLSLRDRDVPVSVLAGELLRQCGDKNYLLRFYSREVLFSDEARHQWVAPDLAEIGEFTLMQGCSR